MAKAERALEGIGVSIRGETADSLRDIEDIIGDVADAWDTLSDSERQAVSEAMAGTQRSSMFSALIENYDKVLELRDEGLNSFGELAEANQKRVESFEGQLNILKDKMLAFTDGLQPLIFGSVELGNNLLDLVNAIGAIPTVVGLASASFLSFSDSGQKVKNTIMEMVGAKNEWVNGLNQIISAQNQKIEATKNELAIKQQEISSTIETIAKLRLEHSALNDNTDAIKKNQETLVGLNEGLIKTQKELALATLKATAFQAVLSLGMSAAISVAIALVGKLAEELKDFAWSSEEAEKALGSMQDSLEDYNNLQVKTKETKDEITSLKSINEKIKNNALAYKEQKDLIDTIQEKLEGLAESYPGMASVLKSDNIELETKIKLLERQLELEEKQASMKATQDLGGNVAQKIENGIKEQMDDIEYAKNTIDLINKGKVDIGQLDSANQMIEEAKIEIEALLLQSEVAKATLETALSHGFITEEYYRNQVEKLDATIEKYKEYGSGVRETVEEVKSDTKDVVESAINSIASLSDTLKSNFESETAKSSLASLRGSLSELEEGSDEAKEVLELLHNEFEDMPDDVDTLADAIDYLNGKIKETSEVADMKDLNESYLKALEGIEEAQELLDSFKDGLDVGELRSIFDSDLMEGFNGSMTDAVAVQEHLNEKIAEMQEIAAGAYYDMNRESSEFWNSQIKNSQEWADYEKQTQDELTQYVADTFGIQLNDFQNYINEKGGLRDVDISNAENLADAERILNGDLNSQILGFFSQFINGKADARVDDMDNVVAFLKAQNTEEVKTIEQLAKLWNEYYNKKKAEISATLTATKNVTMTLSKTQQSIKEAGEQALKNAGLQMPGVKDHYSSLYDQSIKTVEGNKQQVAELNKQLQALEKENNSFSDLLNNLNGYNATNSLKQNYTNANKGNFTGSSSSGNKGSSSSGNKGSSSSSSEKEVADLDLKIDKYQELEEAINRVDEALTRNQQAQETATTKAELKKLLEEEVKLMERKKKAIGDLQTALKSEQQSLKQQLEKSGLLFEGDELVGDKQFGTIAKRLEDAQKWANSAKGAEKEWRIKDTEYLKETIDAYYDLMNQLGDTTSEYNDMVVAIREAKKEQEELLKQVENLADRYLQFTMKASKIDNKLSLNRRKQEYAVGAELVKLREEELKLLEQQRDVSAEKSKELKSERDELLKTLKQAGFTFDSDGLISNYDKKWQDKTDKYNTLAGYEAEDYKEYLDELAESIDRYLDIVNSELPEAEEAYYDYLDAVKELEEQQKVYAEQIKEVVALHDKLFDVTQKLTKASNELSLIEAQLKYAQGEDKIVLLQRQLEIYEAQTKALEEQRKIQENMAKEQQLELSGKGFTFDEDGYITNYDSVIGNMAKEIEKMEGGTARDEAIEEYEKLIEAVKEYVGIISNDLPSTELEWQNITNAIKDAQREQLQIVQDVQESISNAIKNKWQENTEALQEEIDKQKEILNKQWNEEDWDDKLNEAQDNLNKLQAQINNLSKDTSLAGQLKLEQLKEEYEEQLKAMNDMIKEHEREQANQAFEDEKNEIKEEMDNALTAENLAQSVNNALANGIVNIGDEVVSLNDLMIESIMSQESAYYALGEVMKSEMIGQLETALGLWKDISKLSAGVTSNVSTSINGSATKSGASSILANNQSPLISMEFNGSELTKSEVESLTKGAIDDLMIQLNKMMG